MRFNIRNANLADLDAIMQVEQHWPEDQRSTADKFVSRLEIFPQGFFLVEVEGEVVGVSTSTLVRYNHGDLSPFFSWDKCTNNGELYPLDALHHYNALYIVSNGIMKQVRRSGVREGIIHAHMKLAKQLNMRFVVTGAMMPGYNAYCEEHGDIPITDYAFLVKDGDLVDPTLNKLSCLGLKLLSTEHIIKDYYHSPESRDFGALLVCELPK